MKLPFYWIDAFTSRLFAGNPAGVVPLEAWPPAEQMQLIARENGLSETAFYVRQGPGRFRLRWFTPACEVDLCGHATLAAGHVALELRAEPAERVVFETLSGELSVARRSDGRLELDFPSRPGAEQAPPDALVAALGARPVFTAKSRDFLCVYRTEEEVRGLRPDFARLLAVDALGVIATAPGADCDFVSRFFAPRAGVPEDPVTGSAHCTLVPYWVARLGRATLHARQISARGGELFCTLAGDRVRMAGDCALYLQGEISV